MKYLYVLTLLAEAGNGTWNRVELSEERRNVFVQVSISE